MKPGRPAAPTPDLMRDTKVSILREAWNYSSNKPGKVPPADSRNRPALARLWQAAYAAAERRANIRTFKYFGLKFGVVYLGSQLCVMDLGTRTVLVRQPTSMMALSECLADRKNPNFKGSAL